MKKTTLFTTALVAVGTLFASAGLAGAAAISDVNQVSNFPESDYGDIGWTSVAAHPNGNSLVVYFGFEVEANTSADQAGYHYIQMLGPDGAALTDPARVGPSEDRYYFAAPAAAYNPVTDGWSVFLIPSREGKVIMQNVDDAGALDGAAVEVWSSDPAVDMAQANVAWVASENHFLFAAVGYPVTPLDAGNSDTQWFTLTISAIGTLLSGPTVVGDAYSPYSNGQMAYSATSDRALLVTVGEVATGDTYAPFAQLTNGDGARIGNTIRMLPNAEAFPVAGAGVAWNASTNKFLVVWSSNKNNDCASPTSACGLYGQLVNTDGTLSGDTITFYSTTDANEDIFRPQLTANGASNEYAIVWHTGPAPYWNNGTNVWALRVSGAGAPIDEAFNVSDFEGGENSVHLRPAITLNNNECSYVVTWQGVLDDTANTILQQIYSRTIETGETCTLPSTGMSQTTTLVAFAMMAAGALTVQTGRRRRLA